MGDMPIYETYERRQQELRETETDPLQYDDIPSTVRNQIEYIWRGAIGRYYIPSGYDMGSGPRHNSDAWDFIRDTLWREVAKPISSTARDAKADCVRLLHDEKSTDRLLSLVELSFRYIDLYVGKMRRHERERLGIEQSPTDAIEELNSRFQKAAVGYRYEDGRIVRVDSELIHAEVVKPALSLLSQPGFTGPQEEFLEAHKFHREGKDKQCVTSANNAFESTMKAICDIKGWEYNRGDRASDLLKVLRANGLFPDYLDKSFEQTIAVLKSGLPQVRNNAGGHGQGPVPKTTPSYIGAYALHLAAAKIVLLVEAMNDVPEPVSDEASED